MDSKYRELKQEMQKNKFTCCLCRYAKRINQNTRGYKCTNPKWDSNFVKFGWDFCSDFEEIQVNIPEEFLEGI